MASHTGFRETPSVVRSIVRGDARAFNDLVIGLYPALLDFAMMYVTSVDAAEDVLQESFIRLWERRESLNPELPIKPLVYRIVRNEALDHNRRVKTAQRYASQAATMGVGIPQAGDQASSAVELHDIHKLVDEVVGSLPDRCREIYIMSRRGGLSYPEIAETLGISLSAVKTQMGRALQALAKRIGSLMALMLAATR